MEHQAQQQQQERWTEHQAQQHHPQMLQHTTHNGGRQYAGSRSSSPHRQQQQQRRSISPKKTRSSGGTGLHGLPGGKHAPRSHPTLGRQRCERVINPTHGMTSYALDCRPNVDLPSAAMGLRRFHCLPLCYLNIMPHRVSGGNKNGNSNSNGVSTNSSLFRQQRQLDGAGRAAHDVDDDAEVDVCRNKTTTYTDVSHANDRIVVTDLIVGARRFSEVIVCGTRLAGWQLRLQPASSNDLRPCTVRRRRGRPGRGWRRYDQQWRG